MDPRRQAAAFQRVRIRSIATVPAVATVKIDRGRQYKNTKSCRNHEIQSQTRVVNGIAALVTTPLRLLVTRAPSGQASHVPGIRLSQGLLAIVGADLRNVDSCPLGSTGAAERGPALGTRVGGSRCRGGQDLGTQWTTNFLGVNLPSI